jgi:hypothetical protein
MRLTRNYLQHGIRRHAEEICTQQLGYRTTVDIQEATLREISQARVTSLERIIARQDPRDDRSSHFAVIPLPPQRLVDQYIVSRLQSLEEMGLAEQTSAKSWQVRRDFEQVLRSMQKAADRQRTLTGHGLPVSDKRLPFEVVNLRHMKILDGRVLVHGEEEVSGHHYFMLEGTDAKIHLVFYTEELEKARTRGKLRPGSFVTLRKQFDNGKPVMEVNDLGNAEALLENRRHFDETAKRLLRRGISLEEHWEGWLGRYHTTLRAVIVERERDHEPTARDR